MFAALQARLDLLVQNYTRGALQTFAVAESGLEHALADIAADPRFERLLAGPDRQSGTADDGQFPFTHPPPELFPAAPFRYEVRVAAVGADRAEITARAFGPLGAVRTLVATVARDAQPAIAAALALARGDPAIALGGGFQLAGADRSATAPAVAGLAIGDAAEVAATGDRLGAAVAQITGAGGSPSITSAALPDLAALAGTAARHSGAVTLGSEAGGTLGTGLFVAPGSLRLSDASGSGVLVVGGTLELAGMTTFTGLVVALGDVRIDPGNTVTIDGAVLGGGAAVSLRGSGRIGYDAREIARVDAAYPGLLPRRARITGWREQPDAGI